MSASYEREKEDLVHYDLSDLKMGKNTPFTLDKLQEFFLLLSGRADTSLAGRCSARTSRQRTTI